MSYLGWGLFLLMFALWRTGIRHSSRWQLNMLNYVIYLLMDDTIYQDQKDKFRTWVLSDGSTTLPQLVQQAHSVLENHAAKLNLTVAATVMLGKFKWHSGEAYKQ